MNLIAILLILFIIFQFLDIYTTRKVLKQGGKELNPILNYLMSKFGVDRTLNISKFIIVVLFLFLYNLNALNITMMVILNLIYFIVIVNNFRQIKK